MLTSSPHTFTLSEASRLIHERQVTPLELVEACLSRIDTLNLRLKAFLYVSRETALEEADYATKSIARGEPLWGPLHGIPVGIKDLLDVEGMPATAGSDFFRSRVASRSAETVTRLQAAGAIIIGKTHMHEFAIGATNVNPHYGPARNPWNPAHMTGGSSGGSAGAVIAGMCPAALGSDTGGSVRVPAAFCGLTGLRPGKGQISTDGTIPLSWTLDTVGPMAASAQDIAVLMDTLCDRTSSHNYSLDQPVRGLRIGIPLDDYFWMNTGTEVAGAVRAAAEALEDQGVEVCDVRLPDMDTVHRAAGLIAISDGAAYHAERLRAEPERFGPDVRARLEAALRHSAAEYAQARQRGREWRALLRGLFRESVDCLLLPTTSMTAPLIEGSEGVSATQQILSFTYPFSLSGLPSLSMPCGFDQDGLPIGAQLAAPGVDALLQLAHAYQSITDWHQRRPLI
ncbi:MAG: amidase [Anaerolineae bacterium]|nr:amidase [Anaerolineae bacterium]